MCLFVTLFPESRLMHGSPRIAVAELFLFTRNDQSFADQGLQKRIVVRRYCLSLSNANH